MLHKICDVPKSVRSINDCGSTTHINSVEMTRSNSHRRRQAPNIICSHATRKALGSVLREQDPQSQKTAGVMHRLTWAQILLLNRTRLLASSIPNANKVFRAPALGIWLEGMLNALVLVGAYLFVFTALDASRIGGGCRWLSQAVESKRRSK